MTTTINSYNIIFNEKAVKEIALEDDILYIRYVGLDGNDAELMCPDLNDAEHFLLSTVKHYTEDTLSPELLRSFIAELESLKYRMEYHDRGFCKMSKIQYARYMIRFSIENVFRLKTSQDAASAANIYSVHVDLDEEKVCIEYKKRGLNSGTDALILNGETSYDDIYSFIDSCLPKLEVKRLTFGQADILSKELYDLHLCKTNSPVLV